MNNSRNQLMLREKFFEGRKYLEGTVNAYGHTRKGDSCHPSCVVTIGGKCFALKYIEHSGETRKGTPTVGFFVFRKIEGGSSSNGRRGVPA